jgi:hypothetical protein
MEDISGSGKGGRSSSDPDMLLATGIENLRMLVLLAKRLPAAMESWYAMFVPWSSLCAWNQHRGRAGEKLRELDLLTRRRLNVEGTWAVEMEGLLQGLSDKLLWPWIDLELVI